jgi:hypothetical protein
MEGGPDQINYDKREVTDWVNKMAQSFAWQWQAGFFNWLWSALEAADDDEARRLWFEELKKLTDDVFEGAVDKAPRRHGRGYKSVVRANGIYWGGLYKKFPDLMEGGNG